MSVLFFPTAIRASGLGMFQQDLLDGEERAMVQDMDVDL